MYLRRHRGVLQAEPLSCIEDRLRDKVRLSSLIDDSCMIFLVYLTSERLLFGIVISTSHPSAPSGTADCSLRASGMGLTTWSLSVSLDVDTGGFRNPGPKTGASESTSSKSS